MKRVISILSVILALSVFTDLQAQNLKKFMKRDSTAQSDTTKTRQKLKGRSVENMVRGGVNKGLNRIFGADKEEKSGSTNNSNQNPASDSPDSASGSQDSSSPNSGNSESGDSPPSATNIGMNALMSAYGMKTANVPDEYVFDGYLKIKYEIHEAGNDEIDEEYLTNYLSNSSYNFGIKVNKENSNEHSTIIFDTEENQMLTLIDSDDSKSGIAVAMEEEDMEELIEESVDEGEDENAVYKTGKTKKIQGYTCHEYEMKSPEATVNYWVTKELNEKINRNFSRNSSYLGFYGQSLSDQGVVMEYKMEDQEGNKTIFYVTEVDLDSKIRISTNDYNIMDMGDPGQYEEEEE